MKFKLGTIGLGVAASVVLLTTTSVVQVQDKTFLNCGSGGAVRDPFGNCLLSAGGTAIPECLPAMAKEPEPQPGPMIVSLAADATFDFDRSDLKPAAQQRLSQLASDMSQVQVNSVDIVGHTDSIGSEAYNQALSERRAASAADFLVAQGVNSGLITTRGMGELQPIAPNTNPDGSDNPAGRAQNRRVDITVDANQPQ